MEWISVNEKFPKGCGAIVNVKRSDGSINKVYYHADGGAWLLFYNVPGLSMWQDFYNSNFYRDVTHWAPLEKTPKEKNEAYYRTIFKR